MKVSTMRTIDRWAGVPICLLLSPFAWLSDLLRGAKSKQPDLSRALFIELSEMGSAVIADPAMRKLAFHGKSELYFVIFKKNYKSLEILNTIPAKNVFKMNADNFISLTIDIFRFMAWCRRKKIRTTIDLELFSRFTAILAFFSGARSRVGFTNFHDEGLYRGNLVNKSVRYNPHVHIAINFISLVNKALQLFPTPYPWTQVNEEELELAKAIVPAGQQEIVKAKIKSIYPGFKNERLVLFNVNASDMLPQRRWPQENFSAVASRLLEKYNDILLIGTGAPSEKKYVQKVIDQTGHSRFVNSAGLFWFDELVPLYSISTLMLTNDSGPAHFAAVTNLKVFVLFGPETPHLYLPLGGNAEPFYLGLPCSPCVSAANHRKTSCKPRPCITGIHPVIVLEKLDTYLGTRYEVRSTK